MLQKWLFPTVSEVLLHSSRGSRQTDAKENGSSRPGSRIALKRMKAERQWCSAIASLEDLLLQEVNHAEQEHTSIKGLVLAGPVPVLSNPEVVTHFQTSIFTAEVFQNLMPSLLLPATTTCHQPPAQPCLEFPLPSSDPLAAEQFCLVLTGSFSLAMVLGEDAAGSPLFEFSFDPEDIQQVWRLLRSRVALTVLDRVSFLDNLVQQFSPTAPDYRKVMQFTRQLLQHLPEDTKVKEVERDVTKTSEASPTPAQPHAATAKDVELLEALIHEIRTPLTTIRTLTRLLLKRHNLASDVTKRLETIDRECTEQINRMELIFRAVELARSEVNQAPVHLTPMSLNQLLQQSIPQWKTQAERRNLTLDVTLPQRLPTVVSNPAILDQVLTGLIENFTRNIPSGSHIQVEVTTAGDRLKLQLQSHFDSDETGQITMGCYNQPTIKSIGQMLIFQPETGSLSLNLNTTKNLFQALGGKLIVRQREQQGEVLTIFLPLEAVSKQM